MKSETDDILVLCVDRDDDLGKKTNLSSPVIGREENLEAAQELALSDPTDTDVNSIYEAIKVYDKQKDDVSNLEVATVTGSENLGVEADQEISRQLDEIKEMTDMEKVILVTDGAQDDRIMPLVQSRFDIVSKDQAIVKQSQELESSYYVVKDFLHDLGENSKMAKVFLGVPSIIFLIYALFGSAGWRLIIGSIGAYLFIKGFSLENSISNIYNEFKTSLLSKKGSFFFYFLSIVMGLVGIGIAYREMSQGPYLDVFNKALLFIKEMVFFIYLAGIFLGIGRLIRNPVKKNNLAFGAYLGVGFSVTFLIYNTILFILDANVTLYRLFGSIILASTLTLLTLFLEKALG